MASWMRYGLSAGPQQFTKISDNIMIRPEHALDYAEARRLYSENLKRKYDQIAGHTLNSEREVTPMEEPRELASKCVDDDKARDAEAIISF
ncbi:hypothetical protein DFQ28_000209, partial [Apophysomyces sp. BC1034]